MPDNFRGRCKNPFCGKRFQRNTSDKVEVAQESVAIRGHAMYAVVCPHCGDIQTILRKKGRYAG